MDLNERIIAHAEAVCRPEGCAFEIVSAWSVQSENLLKSHMKEEEFELLCEKTKAMAKTRFDELVDKSEAGAKAEHCRLLHGEVASKFPCSPTRIALTYSCSARLGGLGSPAC